MPLFYPAYRDVAEAIKRAGGTKSGAAVPDLRRKGFMGMARQQRTRTERA